MKKIMLLLCMGFILILEARIVDGIAFIVEGEAVTTAEIRALRTQMRVSKAKAIDILIQDRLQKSAMRDIKIEKSLIDIKISEIASQNNISIAKMKKVLKAQGTSWKKYHASIEEAMKKEKFFRQTIRRSIPDPTEGELKTYFKKHKSTFVLPSTISVIEYSTKTEKAMQDFLTTKNKKGVKSKRMKKKTKDLNPTLLESMLQTANKSFTPSLNAGDRFVCYKVLSKNGKRRMNFTMARGAITQKWKQEQQGKVLKDYFQKLKTNIDIEYIRR